MDKITADEIDAVALLHRRNKELWTIMADIMLQLEIHERPEIIRKLIKSQQKLSAVKLVKIAKGWGLKEAKDFVDEIDAGMEHDAQFEAAGFTIVKPNVMLDVSETKKKRKRRKSPKCYNCEVGTITDTVLGLCTDCQMHRMNGEIVVTKPKPQEEDTPW